MYRRIVVGDVERAVVIRRRRFERVLEPGEYRLFGLGLEIETHKTASEEFVSEWADFLATQRKDVAESVESLKVTIQEINETSSERFKATFDEVNQSFGEATPGRTGTGPASGVQMNPGSNKKLHGAKLENVRESTIKMMKAQVSSEGDKGSQLLQNLMRKATNITAAVN